ncbi:MAG: DMT family transporter, partial [Ilumatobacteraceae bacterium]
VTALDERVDGSPNSRAAGVIAVMSASAFWSFGGVLGKSTGASGIVLSFWRMLISTLVLFVVSAVMHRWPSRRDIRTSALAGVLFGLNICCFFITLQYTTIAVALIIGALSPVVALPIAVAFMGERATTVKIVCALAAVAGVVMAVIFAPSVDEDAGTKPIGYMWAVISLLVWVMYLLQTKRVRATVETVRYMTCVSAIGACTVAILALVTRSHMAQIHGRGWLWVTLLAIGPGIAGHGLVAWAQPRVDASVTSVLIQLEPVGASIAAWVFLSERVSLLQGVAMTGVVAALCVLAYSESLEQHVALDEGLG